MGLFRTLTTLGIGAVAGYYAAQHADPASHEAARRPSHAAPGLRIVVVGREAALAGFSAPTGRADPAEAPATGRTPSARGKAHVHNAQ